MYDIDNACKEALERINKDIQENVDEAKSVIKIQFTDLKHKVDLLHEKQINLIENSDRLFDELLGK